MLNIPRTTIAQAIMCSMLSPFCQLPQAADLSLSIQPSYRTSSNNEKPHSFNLDLLGIQISQDFNDTISMQGEVLVDTDEESDATEIQIDRLFVSNHLPGLFHISVGKFLNPVSYWNTDLPRTSMQQKSVTRPFFLEHEQSETGMLPIHTVGVQVSDKRDNWGYHLLLGNSNGLSGSNDGGPNDHRLRVFHNDDLSREKSLTARFYYHPPKWFDRVGIAFASNNITETSEDSTLANKGDILFDQHIVAFDAHAHYSALSTRLEFFYQNIKDVGNGEQFDSYAYYLQLAYEFSKKLSGVFRFESLDYDEQGPYLQLMNLTAERHTVVGGRYHLSESSNIRLEINQVVRDLKDDYSSLILQWYFLWI